MRTLALTIILVALGVLGAWLFMHGDESTQDLGDGPDLARTPAQLDGAAPIALDVTPEDAHEREGVRPDPERKPLPWDPEVLEAVAKDRWALPAEQRPFLHVMLNNRRTHRKRARGESLAYQPDLDSLIEELPPEFEDKAEKQRSSLEELLTDLRETARPLEMEQWRLRAEAYHRAVESGQFVVVDHTGANGPREKAERNLKARRALRLGEHNRDFFYITATSLSDAGERGPYNAIIYVRRRDYPDPFELMDELRRIHDDARQRIKDYLGIPR